MSHITENEEQNVFDVEISEEQKIKDIFPNCKEDVCFGGNKKLIKISREDGSDICYCIGPHYTVKEFAEICEQDPEPEPNEIILHILDLSELMRYETKDVDNFTKLLYKRIIIPGEIHDFNSPKFIKALNKTKQNIKIEEPEKFTNFYKFNKDSGITNIYEMLCFEVVINDNIYCKRSEKLRKIKDFEPINIYIKKCDDWSIITLNKINKKYYDRESFLRPFVPYLIIWDGNKNFYNLNRDYDYIGLNSKSVDQGSPGGGQCYLFNNGSQPWNSREMYSRMCNEYMRIIKENDLKVCKNPFEINKILSLLD